eukprot:COSAG02_NODE_3559_length_6563_cov_4.152382_11_plen_95_part_00
MISSSLSGSTAAEASPISFRHSRGQLAGQFFALRRRLLSALLTDWFLHLAGRCFLRGLATVSPDWGAAAPGVASAFFLRHFCFTLALVTVAGFS